MTEEEMVGWHHELDGHEFEQGLEAGDGQGSLVCCMKFMGSKRVGHDLGTEQQRNFSKGSVFMLRCTLSYEA